MRAVVTGINGQDGVLLADRLVAEGYSVFGVSRPRTIAAKPFNDSVISVNLDLGNRILSTEFLNSIKPDLIFHLAAVHASSAEMKNAEIEYGDAMLNCHVGITQNILDWQKVNQSSRSVIALSSQMYRRDIGKAIKIDESSTPNSTTKYGATKAEAWRLIKRYRAEFGILSAGVVLFNHASIYSKSGFLFSELASKISKLSRGESKDISVRNPNSFIDITSAEEICDAIFAVSVQDNLQDFVLGSGKSQTISDILKSYSEFTGKSFETEFSESDTPEHCLVSNIDLAKNELDWVPTKPPAQILSEMVENLLGVRTK